jgi:hypothetical protein
MSTQRNCVTPYPIETFLAWMKSGEIAIPEIQHSFVLKTTNERSLLYSLHYVCPVGYVIAWLNHTVKFKKCSELLQGIKLMGFRIKTRFEVLL